jgi:hypothetical protein
MTRRITTGEVGGAVGGINTTNTTLSAVDNVDIVVNPKGTARFVISGDAQLQEQGDLRFGDADSSNYVGFQAPATIASNVLWTLPAIDGTNLQTLSTNGTGTLSWQTTSVSLEDNTSDSATHYVTLTDATTDAPITTIRRSSTKLIFQPSTGTLTSTVLIANGGTASASTTTGALVVTGGVGISGAVNIGGSLTVATIAGVSGYVLQTAGASLQDIDRKYVVANTASITLTLPATTTDGRTITIVDGNNFSSFNVTLGRNGRNIGGLAENLILNLQGSKVELVYRGGDWKVFAI